jgi:hypothetical protein
MRCYPVSLQQGRAVVLAFDIEPPENDCQRKAGQQSLHGAHFLKYQFANYLSLQRFNWQSRICDIYLPFAKCYLDALFLARTRLIRPWAGVF